MFKSFLPLARLFASPLQKQLFNTPKVFFAAGKGPAGPVAPKKDPKSDQPPSRFPALPVRKPLEPGEEQDYEPFHTEFYMKLIGEQKKPRITRSAYVCVERRGKVYHLFDAERIPLGRMCQSIVKFIQGKHKPIYRHDRTGYGDECVVVNAEKMKLTGKKAFYKSVKYHTGYIGHLREIPYKTMILEKPEQLVHRIVSKMLPKNRLRPEYLESLHVYRGAKHPLTKYLPNFGILQETYDDLIEKVKGDNTAENSVIVYQSQDHIPEEFKDYKVEIDHSLEIPLSEREYKVTDTAENKKTKREYLKYLKKLRRFKEYKVKAPKKVNIFDLAQKETVFIQKDWHMRKLGYDKLEASSEVIED